MFYYRIGTHDPLTEVHDATTEPHRMMIYVTPFVK